MKTVTVKVQMTGYVYQEIEVEDDVIITDDNVYELVLDKFDFADASDIEDSIEWKLRHADSIEIYNDDDEGDILWSE